MAIILAIIFFLLMLIFSPLLTIWALNTLFSLGIAYTFSTWFAMLWVNMLLAARVVNSK